MGGSPFSRRGERFRVNLSKRERKMIAELPEELIKHLESGDDASSTYRLFPPGYTNDLEMQVEYDNLMRDDLQSRHVECLRLLQDQSDADELSEQELESWLRALNQLRLVLGTRLDVTEDMSEEDLSDDDPRAASFALYGYLGYLQEHAIEAINDGS